MKAILCHDDAASGLCYQTYRFPSLIIFSLLFLFFAPVFIFESMTEMDLW